jgi:predicted dehydrogenase
MLPAILRSGQCIAAVAGRDPARLAEFQAEFAIPAAYPWDQAQRLLENPKIDAIYIPLPNSLHADWTVRALESGKHVLCEKPLALTVAEAGLVASAAVANNLVLMENFSYHLAPIYRYLAQVQSPLKAVFLRHTFQATDEHRLRYYPALGGGSFLDLGCYGVDFVHRLFGSEIKVYQVLATSPAPERQAWGLVDEKCSLAGRTASGIGSSVHSSFSRSGTALPAQSAALFFADSFHPRGRMWFIQRIFHVARDTPTEIFSNGAGTTPLEVFDPFDADVALLNTFAEKIAAPKTDPADILRWRRNASVLEQVQGRIVEQLKS